jgi:hypothetical protein
MDLLFLTCYWHSLAKLRMHTDTTLEVLDTVTIAFGQKIRHFAEEICRHFNTVETDSEYMSRKRAEGRREARGDNLRNKDANLATSGKRSRGFNLMTSKLHALGDYVAQIRMFGTTDSFTSQIVGRTLSFYEYH